VAAFEVQADTRVPYRIVEVPLPRLEGRHPFVLAIEAPSDNPRPLGLALDWMELTRASGDARLVPPRAMLGVRTLTGAAAYLARCGRRGAGRRACSAASFRCDSVGSAHDPMGAERILREGSPVYAWYRSSSSSPAMAPRPARLGVDSPRGRGLADPDPPRSALRLTLLLHPQFYYPT
jgi:hypothetical protein